MIECQKCGHVLTVEKTKVFETHLCENCFQYAKVIPVEPCCTIADYQPVKFLISGGAVRVRKQCTYCGNVHPDFVGGYSAEDREKLPMIDLNAKESRFEMIDKAWERVQQRKQSGYSRLYEVKREERLQEYSNYLRSDAWRNLRALVMKRDNYTCQSCLTNRATQVHHKSYELVDLNGSEPCFDLVSICTPCHARIEALKKANRRESA